MSSHKNKTIRERLERIYGKGCMFQKAHIAQRIEEIGGIKTYKQYIQQHKYSFKKVKKLEETMTLHHLKHRADDGRTSEQNGAVINALAHGYLHSLPRNEEEIINNMLRDYKWRIDNGRECKIELVDTLDIGIEVKVAEISFSDEIKPPKEKFNRAKVKEETRNKIKDWEERKIMAKESQKERVLKHINQYGSITQKEAWELYGASRLSAIIYDLKYKDGYNIKTEMVKGKNRYGEPTCFGAYSFVEQDEELMKHIPSII